MNQKTVFISGGAGGLGRATSHYLAERDWHVFAGFHQNGLDGLEGNANITPVYIDVRDASSVHAAVEKIKEYTDGLDAVVNFAGILAIGSAIELQEATFQRVLDINVMGTFRVNQACFPLLKRRKGRIINISSETGWHSGGPFNSAYASSKHAIEAYTDSLRREMALLDMPVIKLQPGPFKTNMVTGIESQLNQAINDSSEFKDVLQNLKALAVKETGSAREPAYLAAILYQALMAPKPKPVYSIKPDFKRSLLECLPVRWADSLLKKIIAV